MYGVFAKIKIYLNVLTLALNRYKAYIYIYIPHFFSPGLAPGSSHTFDMQWESTERLHLQCVGRNGNTYLYRPIIMNYRLLKYWFTWGKDYEEIGTLQHSWKHVGNRNH